MEPKENRDPAGPDLIPYPLYLPSHWVAVWLTDSEIPSSKLIAERLGVSWLMRGVFFSRMSGAISADRAGPPPPIGLYPSYGSQKCYVCYSVWMNLFEQNNKLRRDRISWVLALLQVLPCLYLLIFPCSSGWTAGSSSVCSRCPVWSVCLYSTPCVWHTTWELLTRRPCNNSPSTQGSCPTWKHCGQSVFGFRVGVGGMKPSGGFLNLSWSPPGCHSGSCLLMWIQGQRWRGSWGPSQIALEDTTWGRESSASMNIPPASSLTWFVPQMFSNATFFPFMVHIQQKVGWLFVHHHLQQSWLWQQCYCRNSFRFF